MDGDAMAAKRGRRINDPERTKADILAVATREFCEHGFAGARVDDIAEKTQASKRMIYYYFGGKEELYRAVLQNYYEQLRGAEKELHLETLPPLEALKRLIRFTVDYHIANAENVRLVMVENIHRGREINQLPSIEPLNSSIVDMVARICERGEKEGVIRPGLDPMDVYMTIAALSFFNVSNRYTFSKIFAIDMTSSRFIADRKDSIIETVMRAVAVHPDKAA